ncbi:MAG: InlB B-repeat-containing protein [Treponema sp.]|nr:InlB B-repeat-containing protein [Treponema sp.]
MKRFFLLHRIWFLLLALTLSAGVFTGCSGDGGSTDSGDYEYDYFSGYAYYGSKTFAASDFDDASLAGKYDVVKILFSSASEGTVKITYYGAADDGSDTSESGTFSVSVGQAKINIAEKTETTSKLSSYNGTFTIGSDTSISFSRTQGKKITDAGKVATITVTLNANFVADGASEAESKDYSLEVTEGSYGTKSVTLPQNPFSRSGYRFLGWNTSANSTSASYDDGETTSYITKDTTLYAVWLAKSEAKTVTFNANGGTGTMETLYVKSGSSVKLTKNTFTREGYSFVGWAKSADGPASTYSSYDYADEGTIYSVSENITVYAIWKDELHYFITFDANGGEGTMETQTVTKDSVEATSANVTLSKNTFTRSGYVFYGWYTSSETYSSILSCYRREYIDEESFEIKANKKLYAVWIPNSSSLLIKVTYNANDGSANPETKAQYLQNSTYADEKLLPNTFTKEGCAFAGWSKTATATSATYTDGQKLDYSYYSSNKITSDTTLYAVWIEPQDISVTVTVPQATSYTDITLTYNEISYSLKASLSGADEFYWIVDGVMIEDFYDDSLNVYTLSEGLHTVMVTNGEKSATAVVTVTKTN